MSQDIQSNILVREHEINMPQMVNNALSEHWLFKELGDIHWTLLSTGLNKKSSELVDMVGDRLYPTFVRVTIEMSSLISFSENERINISAEIKRYGQSTCLSEVSGICNREKINAKLMTVFSKRGIEGNSRLTKSHAHTKENSIHEFEGMPDFLTEYKLLKKGNLEKVSLNGTNFIVSDNILHETAYTINPYYDVNGVGLLYFASYPIISDFCTINFYLEKYGNRNWIEKYKTIKRDINYFANCNAYDTILFRLNSFEQTDGFIYTSTSLFRQSDQALIARVFTVKEVHE